MNEQELKEWLLTLSKIDVTNLSGELDKAIQQQAEIIESIFLLNDKAIKAKSKLKRISKEQYIKYIVGNTGDPKIDNIKYNRTELDEIISGDDKIVSAKELVEKYNNLLDLYNKALDLIKQKNWNIKSIIEYKKYINGDTI